MAVTLTIDNRVYRRWTDVRVTRSLKRACAGFEIATPGEIDPPILPFAACVLADDGEPIVTGYVDAAHIEIGAHETRTRLTGRSKTADLVDCMLGASFMTNQFDGAKLDAITRAVGAIFGIGVVIGPGVDIGAAFADATFEVSETAWRFLARLARQRGVLVTDDVAGNLVLTTLGVASAPAALATGPGGNVFSAHGVLAGAQRYSKYVVRSQQGMVHTGAAAENQIEGQATDAGVPRFRPWVAIAESALGEAEAQMRAQWEASHRLGGSIAAILSVPEWRANGVLWKPNQLARCTVPRLALADTLLIGSVEFHDDAQGRRTELSVAPPAAFSPKPAQKVAGVAWAGATTPGTGKA